MTHVASESHETRAVTRGQGRSGGDPAGEPEGRRACGGSGARRGAGAALWRPGRVVPCGEGAAKRAPAWDPGQRGGGAEDGAETAEEEVVGSGLEEP